ncbi:MAG TPA: hypothetical protein VN673_19050 [Clostridia bacterium]|nr:hypothetical protein [Clostridia bacterium]
MQTTESVPKKRPVIRVWFVAVVLCWAAFFAWILWPANPKDSPYDLSRADGKLRFYATSYPKAQRPANLTLDQRVAWEWRQYQRRHRKRNPSVYTFPARSVEPCSISGLLNQCMEVSGTQYLIAVEIAGYVEFGSTNALNGAQWVAAFEHALETSGPVLCYDYAKKRNFQDTLLLIRETPRVVKVLPRSKLADYRKAGLVRNHSQ